MVVASKRSLKTARNVLAPVVPASYPLVPTPATSWYPKGEVMAGIDAGSLSDRSMVASV